MTTSRSLDIGRYNMKTFMIGKDRSLKLGKNNDGLIIREKGSKKEAVFTPARWASFRLCLDEIDNQQSHLVR